MMISKKIPNLIFRQSSKFFSRSKKSTKNGYVMKTKPIIEV